MAERRDTVRRAALPPDLSISYGRHPDQVADIWLPSAPGPLLLCWHGGYWRQEFDRGHLSALAADLAERGYVVANLEYRRTGSGGAGGWPATFRDVASAADLMPGLVAAAAPHRVDGASPSYLGHSAGGHLALWAAVRHRLPAGAPGRRATAPPVQGVLALAPVCGVAEAYRQDLDDGAARALLGGGPDQYPDRYAAVDPAALPGPAVPTVLLHGTADDRVPIALSRAYATQHRVRLIELPDADHFALIDPHDAAWPATITALRALTNPR